MSLLKISNLSIQYGEHLILKDFNAKFDAGLHWIKGFNGSGKSSLLKSICGINPVNVRNIIVNNFDLALEPVKTKSQIAYVPDKPEIFPFITGIQYLEFLAEVKKTSLNKDVFDWLEKTNLSKFKDIEFSKMSYGTRRKFALCSLFIGNPPLILLDEPFNGLDKKSLEVLIHWIKSAKLTKSILIVSHEPNIIEELKDSEIIL